MFIEVTAGGIGTSSLQILSILDRNNIISQSATGTMKVIFCNFCPGVTASKPKS